MTVRTDRGSGTGFVIGDGTLVVTCYHVVKDASHVQVSATGTSSVEVISCDEGYDIALLKLSKRLKSRLAIRDKTPEPGAKIYVIGTPLGFLENTISEGIVSGKRRDGDATYLQITAPVSEGSSGSPVLDDAGRVVGMVDFYLVKGQSLNFAVCGYNLSGTVAGWRAREAQLGRMVSESRKAAKRGHKLLGLLAQVKHRMDIFAAASATSESYYQIDAFEYIVVKESIDPGWLQVLLQNGQYGFARSKDVLLLPYHVNVDAAKKTKNTGAHVDGTKTWKPSSIGPSGEMKSTGLSIADFAKNLVGSPYLEGGSDPTTGLGNGQLVQLTYAKFGYQIPEIPFDQADHGTPVERLEKLIPGDRLYFSEEGTKEVTTAAIYVGADQFVVADPTSAKVEIASLTDKVWLGRLVSARRGAPRTPKTFDPKV